MSEQAHVGVTLSPYVVAGYLPRAMPLAPALSKSIATAGAGTLTKELARQLDVDMHAQARWIADPLTYTGPLTGLFGDGLATWRPSQGSLMTGLATEPRWRFKPNSVPHLDVDYGWRVPGGKDRGFPALLFRQAAWGNLVHFPDQLAGFTAAIVVRVRRTHGGREANIFASKAPPHEHDGSAESRLAWHSRHGHIRSYHRSKHHYLDIHAGITERPVIIMWRAEPTQTTLRIGDHHRWSHKHHRHSKHKAYDMSWYLNREATVYSRRRTLVMDIVDICLWDHARTDAQFHQDAHKLNHLYGAVAR